MLIGKIDVKTKQKILVTIQDIKQVTMIDLRVHHTGQDGEMVATEAGISLLPGQIDRAIELLKQAKARVTD